MLKFGWQLKAARALAGVEQIELAKKAKVAIGTIRRMEAFEDREISCNIVTVCKVMRAFEEVGVVFVESGVQMSEPGSK